jgi:hypothetical protein
MLEERLSLLEKVKVAPAVLLLLAVVVVTDKPRGVLLGRI